MEVRAQARYALVRSRFINGLCQERFRNGRSFCATFSNTLSSPASLCVSHNRFHGGAAAIAGCGSPILSDRVGERLRRDQCFLGGAKPRS